MVAYDNFSLPFLQFKKRATKANGQGISACDSGLDAHRAKGSFSHWRGLEFRRESWHRFLFPWRGWRKCAAKYESGNTEFSAPSGFLKSGNSIAAVPWALGFR